LLEKDHTKNNPQFRTNYLYEHGPDAFTSLMLLFIIIKNTSKIKIFFIRFGKVHVYNGTVELIKLRVMSDESIARGQAMLCEIFGNGIKE